MSVQQIVECTPESFRSKEGKLRIACKKIVEFNDAAVQRCVTDLTDTLHANEIAIGLAAPQIGIHLQIAVINLKQADSVDLVLINPEIVALAGSKDKKFESCMSLPHFKGLVIRKDKLTYRYSDIHGKIIESRATGYLARVIQHEVDHLHSELYVDRMVEGSELQPTDLFTLKSIN